MTALVRERHYLLGLSDELSVRKSGGPAGDGNIDISAEARIKLYPRQALSSARDASADQLFHCRKHLVWSTEGRERVRFEAAGPIVDAELCRFAEEQACGVLCVAEAGLFTMYSTDGDLLEHSVKQPVRTLWATPVGVLVEGFEGAAAQYATHMISGLQPVRAVNCGTLAEAGGAYAWECERILFADACTPLCVTADEQIASVRIWCLRAFSEATLPEQAGVPGDRPAPAPASTPQPAAAPHTPLASGSRVRTPEGNIQPHVFTAYRSTDPGTASTWHRDRVELPTEGVILAYDMMYAEPLAGGDTVAHVALSQDAEASPLLAVLTASGSLRFYAVHMPSNSVTKRAKTLEGVEAIVAIEVRDAHLTGALREQHHVPGEALRALQKRTARDSQGQHAGIDEARRCLVALREDALWLLVDCDVLLRLHLPGNTPVHAAQLLHFPQPPTAGGDDDSEMQCESDQGTSAFVLSPDDTDNQFEGPQPGTVPGCTSGDLGRVVHLSHACGATLLVHFGCGANVQVAVALQGQSELVERCFVALHAVLLPGQMREMLQAYHEAVPVTTNPAEEFEHFRSFLLQYFETMFKLRPGGGGAGSTGIDNAMAGAAQADSGDAWQSLLASPIAQQCLSSRSYPAFASLDGVHRAALGASVVENAGASPPRTLTSNERRGVAELLDALHSVFEDLLLDQLTWQHVPPLASLLFDLASLLGAGSRMDYYRRHICGAMLHERQARTALATVDPPLAASADLTSTLQRLIDGEGSSAQAQALPLLVQRGSDAVPRSKHLLSVFRALSHSLDACVQLRVSGAPEDELVATHRHHCLQVLQQLGSFGWTLATLDTLPLGFAVPIHEALQLLRDHPPPDLTPQQYILVGREDLATTVICMAGAPATPLTTIAPPAAEPLLGPRSPAPSPGSYAASIVDALTPLSQHVSLDTPRFGSVFSSSLGSRATFGRSTVGGPTKASLWQKILAASPAAARPAPAASAQWHSRLVLGHCSAQRMGLPTPSMSGLDASAQRLGRDGDAGGKQAAHDDPSQNDLSAPFFRMRFGRDLRLTEALQVLSFSRHVQLRSSADPDPAAYYQAKLALHAARTLALPVGRGALTLSTVNLLPTEPLTAHEIVLHGRLPHKSNTTVAFDSSAFPPALCGGSDCDLTAWPDFHAGAAGGLRITPAASQLTRTWLHLRKPPDATYSHAGLLFALGLRGELATITPGNLYRYLSQEHIATTVGMLLGLGASFRGRTDAVASSTLHAHTPQRSVAFGDLELSPMTQAAAMVGLGLMYEASGHWGTSEMLLQEISRRPETSGSMGRAGGTNTSGPDPTGAALNQEREAYALAAGFSLGLINIGRGHAAAGASTGGGGLVEALRRLILGGTHAAQRATRRADFVSDAVPRWQPSDLWRGDNGDGRAAHEDSAPSHGLSQVVLQGSLVNLDVTSPAATLALTLLFLQTNDAAVADVFALPHTTFGLDYVRPFFILLRVLARALVMWDSVEPTEEWVRAQLPAVLRSSWKESLQPIRESAADGREVDWEAVLLGHIHGIAGAALALGLRYAGTALEPARALVEKLLLEALECREVLEDVRALVAGFAVDVVVVERMVGVCAMALGSIMSGMGDLRTFKLLRALRKRLNLAEAPAVPRGGNAAAVHRGYGVHMAVSMGIGFLFLGGACCKLNTSKSSVAVLLLSMWPALPSSPSDNRCHLQALRHFYVLACNPRIMRAIDVHVRQPVYVPVSLTMASEGADADVHPFRENIPDNGAAAHPTPDLKGQRRSPASAASLGVVANETSWSELLRGVSKDVSQGLEGLPSAGQTPMHSRAAGDGGTHVVKRLCPCIMPEPDLLQAVQVDSTRYWPQRIERMQHGPMLQALCDHAALFVKKRARSLAYSDDPTGVRSLLVTLFQPTGTPGGQQGAGASPGHDLLQMCWTFSSDPYVVMFALAFCQQGGGTAQEEGRAGLQAFLQSTLSQCVVHEQSHLLPMHLQLFFGFQALGAAAALQRPPPRFALPAVPASARTASGRMSSDSTSSPVDVDATPRRMSARIQSRAQAAASVSTPGLAPPPPAPPSLDEEPSQTSLTRTPAKLAPLIVSPVEPHEPAAAVDAPSPHPIGPGPLDVRVEPNETADAPDEPPNGFGWSAQCIAGPIGTLLLARHLALASAYYRTPLAAAARLGAAQSEQQRVLSADFLRSCTEHLERVLTSCRVLSAPSAAPPEASAPLSSASASFQGLYSAAQRLSLTNDPAAPFPAAPSSTGATEAAPPPARPGLLHRACKAGRLLDSAQLHEALPASSECDRTWAASLLATACAAEGLQSLEGVQGRVDEAQEALRATGAPLAPELQAMVVSGAANVPLQLTREILQS